VTGPVRARPQGDDGTTLAEMLVAMVVFGVLAALLATTVLQTTRMTRTSVVRETSAQRASVAMAQVSKDLRTALPVGPTTGVQLAFEKATATEVVFFSSVEPSVRRERLVVDGATLVREVTEPDPGTTYPALTFTTGTAFRTRKVVQSGLDLGTTAGVFTYFLGTSATGVDSVAAADLQAVTAVEVRLAVDGDGPGGVKPVVLRTTVRPYNL
jgi:type II secretory pathway pseudopilin PulG